MYLEIKMHTLNNMSHVIYHNGNKAWRLSLESQLLGRQRQEDHDFEVRLAKVRRCYLKYIQKD
jgi:hypothetical protein